MQKNLEERLLKLDEDGNSLSHGMESESMLMLRVDVAQAYVFQISRLLAPTPTKLRSLVKLH